MGECLDFPEIGAVLPSGFYRYGRCVRYLDLRYFDLGGDAGHSFIGQQSIGLLVGIGDDDDLVGPGSTTSFSSPAFTVASDPTMASLSLLSTAARS